MNIAFIPVRGGSKSIPLKNIKLIAGKPLLYWVLDAAAACTYISKIFISTDSSDIANIAGKFNSDKVIVVNRSEKTATDTASTESAMLEFAEKYDFENMVLIQATSPLLTTTDLNKGFEQYFKEDVDSVLSVVRVKRFVWGELDNKHILPSNYDYHNRPRRQEFPGFLVENGAFYITSKDKLLKTKSRLSGKISFVEMDEDSYHEIDDEIDWIIVEELLKKRRKNKLDFSKVKMLLTDCDGVLTDAGMYYSENGDELKKFNTKDGMAFKLLKSYGILTGIISGEKRDLIVRRANKLNVDVLYTGIEDKLSIIDEICKDYLVSPNEIAYIGDDINDIPVMQSIGFPFCVNDAMAIVKKNVCYITQATGGHGAFREVAELIMNSREKK